MVNSSPYMLKIIDIPGAISCRRYPPGLSTQLRFRLQGDFLSENNGGYAIGVAAAARSASATILTRTGC